MFNHNEKSNGNYPIHEVASAYPAMIPEEYAALVRSLEEHGQKSPMYLWKDQDGEMWLIDGRNREKAIVDLQKQEKLNFEPIYQEFEGTLEDVKAFVEILNLHRRHLTASQKAAVGYRLYYERETQKSLERQHAGVSQKVDQGQEKGKTSEIIAKLVGTNHDYISKAKKVMDRSQDLLEKVEDGQISIVDAETVSVFAQDEELQDILNKISDGKGYKSLIKNLGKPKKEKPEPPAHIPSIIILDDIPQEEIEKILGFVNVKYIWGFKSAPVAIKNIDVIVEKLFALKPNIYEKPSSTSIEENENDGQEVSA